MARRSALAVASVLGLVLLAPGLAAGATATAPAALLLQSPLPKFHSTPTGPDGGRITVATLPALGMGPGTSALRFLSGQRWTGALRSYRTSSPPWAMSIAIFELSSTVAARDLVTAARRDSSAIVAATINQPVPGFVTSGLTTTGGAPSRTIAYAVWKGRYAAFLRFTFPRAPSFVAAAAFVVRVQMHRIHGGRAGGLFLVTTDRGLLSKAGLVVLIPLLALLAVLLAVWVRRLVLRSRDLAPSTMVSKGTAFSRSEYVGVPEVALAVPVATATVPAVADGRVTRFIPAPSEPSTPVPSTFFCSWCGVEREAGQLAVHHCGSRRRPPEFCMRCGKPVAEATGVACQECGTPISLLSPR